MPKRTPSRKSESTIESGTKKTTKEDSTLTQKKTKPLRNLLIVESPTKARTIKNYLGQDFEVLASKGHIKDLPENRLGVDVKNNFRPEIIILPGKGPTVREIQQKALTAKEIYIGSDPDREGEAIAQHIKEEILKKAKNKPVKRALFFEITKEEILKALQNAGDIDEKKVEAQKARRILDRLVGYMVSPLLWRTIKKGLSAGRVQSVALRLICERERERLSFKKEKFYIIKVRLCLDGVRFWATLKVDEPISSKKQADAILQELRNRSGLVEKFEKKILKIKPYPPLKTSTLQQEASRRFRFSPGKTMQVAQRLYEGVIVEGKNTGLITYMRTDSLRLSDKAIAQIRTLIKKNFGENYLPPSPIKHDTAAKLVQGAHEAIRPTKPELDPRNLEGKIDSDLLQIYRLIWKRALACQANYAEEQFKEAVIRVADYTLIARGKKLLFDGFYRILGEIPQYEDIPDLAPGQTLDIVDVIYEIKETEPPPRYTEASLIRTMEQLGIGRPSTYAPTLETLYERKYITREKVFIAPTELGIQVNDVLVPRFKEIFEIKFTARMEELLDQIESGQKSAIEVLKEFYEEFQKELQNFKENIKGIRQDLQKTTETCPLCGAPLLLKWSRYGKFYACSQYPDCKYTRPSESTLVENVKCPLCGKSMILVEGKTGRYYRCSDYPACKGTLPYTIGVKCPECAGEIIERKGRKGKVFYGCSNYPECKFTSAYIPIAHQCPKCNYPVMVEKKKGKTTFLECPKCGFRERKEGNDEESPDI